MSGAFFGGGTTGGGGGGSPVTGTVVYKGAMSASANPNYPAATQGFEYLISAAGKIGGASGISVDIGDVILAIADNAGGTQASVGSSWTILEHNLVGALLAANNLSDITTPATARTNLGLGNLDNTSDANKPVSTAQATAIGLKANSANPTFTTGITTPMVTVSGLTGATSASRYVGATTSGAPLSGTFAVGDFVIDRSGAIWVCTVLGTPGTWTSIAGGGGGGGIVWNVTNQTSNYSAAISDIVLVDATGGSVIVTLPTAPANLSEIIVKMITTASSHTTTVSCGGSDVFNRAGGATSSTLSLTAQATHLIYKSGIWVILDCDLPLSQLDLRYIGTTYVTQNLGTIGSPVSGAQTINWALGSVWIVYLNGNVTFTFSGTPLNPTGTGSIVTFQVTSGNTITWPASVKGPNGTKPQPTSAINSRDKIVLGYDSVNSVYDAALAIPASA